MAKLKIFAALILVSVMFFSGVVPAMAQEGEEDIRPVEWSLTGEPYEPPLQVSPQEEGSETIIQQISQGASPDSPKILVDHRPGTVFAEGYGCTHNDFIPLLIANGYEVSTITSGTLSSASLANVDVFIAVTTYQYPAGEITALKNFVNNGGGLFLIADWGSDFSNPVQPLANAFGVHLDALTVYDTNDGLGPNPPQNGWVTYQRDNFANHPITEGLSKIQSFYATSMTGGTMIVKTDSDGTATPDTRPVVVATTHGSGRVVVVGDTNYFCDCHGFNTAQYPSDNKQFALNILKWLTKGGIASTAYVRSLSTDKSSYKPGDTVYVTYDVDTSLDSQNIRVDIRIYDPNNNVIAQTSRTYTIQNADDDPKTDSLTLSSCPEGPSIVEVTVYDADSLNLEEMASKTIKTFPTSMGIDLQPIDIYHRPVGATECQWVTIYTVIRNNGSQDAYNVELLLTGAPYGLFLPSNNLRYQTVPIVPGFTTVTIAWAYHVIFSQWRWNTDIHVDYDSKIAETNEGNNYLYDHQNWTQSSSPVDFPFDVGNPGASTDTVNLVVREVSIPEGWTVELPNGLHSYGVTLGPGQTQQVIVTIDPGPSPTHSGTIVIDGTLMSTGQTIALKMDVLIPQPDLSLYEDGNLGSPIDVWWQAASPETNIHARVYNKGTANATNVGVEFETSEWGINREWAAAGSSSIPSISSGSSQVASVTIPESQVYNVRARVYFQEATAEWYEYNNIGTRCIKSYTISAGGSLNVVIPVGNESVRGTDTVNLEVDEDSLPPGWTATLSDKSVSVDYGSTEAVTLSITAPQGAQDTTIIVRGTNSAATLSLAEVDLHVTALPPDGDILAYYRGLGLNPDVMETTDLLKAIRDWADGTIPPDFSQAITTVQLLQLIGEWAG